MRKKLFIIWLTKNCNLNCTYCYEKCKEHASMDKKIVDDTATYIIELIKKEKISKCDIHFHGGEPLLEIEKIRYFVELFNDVEECLFDYSVTTNGTLLTEEICKYLNDRFNTISISIDGKKESHDFQRVTWEGDGTFDEVMKHVDWIKMSNKLRVRMTVNTRNVREFFENVLFLHKKGFRWLDPAIDFFNNWTDETVAVLEKNILEVKRYYDDNHIEQNFDLISTEFYEMKGCAGGRENINIDIDGKIYPCSFSVGDRKLCIGDIYSGVINKKLKKVKFCSQEELEECTGCTMKKYCIASNCRILQYKIESDWNRASPILCKLQQIKFHLWKDEKGKYS